MVGTIPGMRYFGWRQLSWGSEVGYQWVPRIEQVELFPQSDMLSGPLTYPGSDGILDSEGSVSAMPDGRTLYAF